MPCGCPSFELRFVPTFQFPSSQRFRWVLLFPKADACNKRVTLTSGEEVGDHVEHIGHGRPWRGRRYKLRRAFWARDRRCCAMHSSRPWHDRPLLNAAKISSRGRCTLALSRGTRYFVLVLRAFLSWHIGPTWQSLTGSHRSDKALPDLPRPPSAAVSDAGGSDGTVWWSCL